MLSEVISLLLNVAVNAITLGVQPPHPHPLPKSLVYALSFQSGCFISVLPSTPHSPESPGAFILAGCFLYENTPIGRQAPLSDTIHCTCMDMKSVLTSTAEFCSTAETAYQWQCRSCD